MMPVGNARGASSRVTAMNSWRVDHPIMSENHVEMFSGAGVICWRHFN
jgi:hypothetical protein